MPLISVIVPNYNHSAFLDQRMDSILSQTFQDFEIILLDDCSTDHSRDIMEKYRKHPKVAHIIFNEKNTGSPFKQWEKGIALAGGEYIWLAESDDWCEPTLLEHLMSGFNQDKECVISYCQSYFIKADNQIVYTTSHNYLSEVITGNDFIKKYLLPYNPLINAGMVLWRKDKFHRISEEYKNYKLCGDWLFWLELCFLGKVHVTGRVLNYFRNHDHNVGGKSFKSGLNFTETLTIINSLYKRNLISPEDYNQGFKIQFRNYSVVSATLDPVLREEIKVLFKHPLTSKSIYYKIFVSAQWRRFKS